MKKIKLTPIASSETNNTGDLIYYKPYLDRVLSLDKDNNPMNIIIDLDIDLRKFNCDEFKDILIDQGYKVYKVEILNNKLVSVDFFVTEVYFINLLKLKIDKMYDDNEYGNEDTNYSIPIPSYLIDNISPFFIYKIIKQPKYIRDVYIDKNKCTFNFRLNNPYELKKDFYIECKRQEINEAINLGKNCVVLKIDINYKKDILDLIKEFIDKSDYIMMDYRNNSCIIVLKGGSIYE